MLAKPGVSFDSFEHLFEIKWNGTRVLAFVDSRGYRRHRADVTDRYPSGMKIDWAMGTSQEILRSNRRVATSALPLFANQFIPS